MRQCKGTERIVEAYAKGQGLFIAASLPKSLIAVVDPFLPYCLT
jgi:hypothetical protein